MSTELVLLELTDFRKVLKAHQPMSRCIVVPKELQHLRFLHIESQRAHGDFELVVIHRPILIRVEELKSFFDLLLLFVCELWTRVRTPFGLLGGRRGVHCLVQDVQLAAANGWLDST